MSEALQHATEGFSDLAASIARLKKVLPYSQDESASGLAAQVRTHLDELERGTLVLAERTQANRLLLAQALHDMRGTLTVLRMNADLLHRTLGDPRSGNLLRNVLKACDDLVSLVVELILLSETETPNFPHNPSWTSLQAELVPLLDSYQHQARSKGLILNWSIAPSVPEKIRVDAFHLRRALGNLLANAVKFTEHGRVTVEISHDGTFLRAAVRDTGPGIPEAVKSSLFEAYRQRPEHRGKRGGGGLGLAVARRLSRAMGGDVVLQSSSEKEGTSLMLTLRT